MKFKELTPQEKIDYVARYIIVHSIISLMNLLSQINYLTRNQHIL